MAEHSAVNRRVLGSSPSLAAICSLYLYTIKGVRYKTLCELQGFLFFNTLLPHVLVVNLKVYYLFISWLKKGIPLMRHWCNGNIPAFQAGVEGSNPLCRSIYILCMVLLHSYAPIAQPDRAMVF